MEQDINIPKPDEQDFSIPKQEAFARWVRSKLDEHRLSATQVSHDLRGNRNFLVRFLDGQNGLNLRSARDIQDYFEQLEADHGQ